MRHLATTSHQCLGRAGIAVAAAVLVILPLGAPGFASAAAAPRASHTARAVPYLQLGSRGPAVRGLQRALARLTYLPSRGVTGQFGMQTWNAVIAFQGWSELARDGVVGPVTSRALARAHRPTPWSRARGIEVHIPQQVLLLVSGGRVQRAVHVSTGAYGATPLGHFRIYRRDPMSWSAQFHVWMPLAQYFLSGYALHEFASVPAYPASHGCIRMPSTDAPQVWRFGSIGMRVWTRS